MVSLKERKALYDRGVDLLAARRWNEAILVFDKIRKDIPNYKETHGHYGKAVNEGQALEYLNQGKGLFLENELAEAKASLEMISKDSVYFRESLRLIREVNNGIVEKKLLMADKSLDEKDWGRARSIAKSVLFIYPDNQRARQILREAMLKQRSLPAQRYARPEPVWTVPVEGKGTSSLAEAYPPPALVLPARGTPEWYLHKAERSYASGDMDGSLRYLKSMSEKVPKAGDRVVQRAEEMADDLHHAKDDYAQADTLQKKGRYSEAVEFWERFLERDRRIIGRGSGSYFRKASASLSEVYYRRGQEEFDRENLRGAYHFWNMARQIHPKNKKVAKGMQQLAESAKEIYREGYVLEGINPDRALEKWSEVMEIVSPGDPYFKKAKSRVDWMGTKSVFSRAEQDLNGLKQVAQSPREIYREGYILEEINPVRALEKWKEIVEDLPRNHPYYNKANKKIRTYEKIP